MGEHVITTDQILEFSRYLYGEERLPSTIQKYLHDVRKLHAWLEGRELTKERLLEWKETLCRGGQAAVTVNAALAAVHSFLAFQGWNECRVKYIRRQRQLYRDASREIKKTEYSSLVRTAAAKGKQRLALLVETICATGIRVSEIRYFTVEAARKGRADISMKGKTRTVLIPDRLAKKLLNYARKQKTACGEIFLTASGKGMSRQQIWREMKALCEAAKVAHSKVFPHNLRHLFARSFYRAGKDIAALADVLGHSSIETTRIYLLTTGEEHAKQISSLGLML